MSRGKLAIVGKRGIINSAEIIYHQLYELRNTNKSDLTVSKKTRGNLSFALNKFQYNKSVKWENKEDLRLYFAEQTAWGEKEKERWSKLIDLNQLTVGEVICSSCVEAIDAFVGEAVDKCT